MNKKEIPAENNEQQSADERITNPLPVSIEDLPVENEKQIKGGPGDGSNNGGGVFLNHNETMAEDDETSGI